MAFSLVSGRPVFEDRAVLLAGDRQTALAELAALADGQPTTGVLGLAEAPGKLAFLFTGQGAQRVGMESRVVWMRARRLRARWIEGVRRV